MCAAKLQTVFTELSLDRCHRTIGLDAQPLSCHGQGNADLAVCLDHLALHKNSFGYIRHTSNRL